MKSYVYYSVRRAIYRPLVLLWLTPEILVNKRLLPSSEGFFLDEIYMKIYIGLSVDPSELTIDYTISEDSDVYDVGDHKEYQTGYTVEIHSVHIGSFKVEDYDDQLLSEYLLDFYREDYEE